MALNNALWGARSNPDFTLSLLINLLPACYSWPVNSVPEKLEKISRKHEKMKMRNVCFFCSFFPVSVIGFQQLSAKNNWHRSTFYQCGTPRLEVFGFSFSCFRDVF